MYEQPDPSAEAIRAQDYEEEQQEAAVNMDKQRLKTRRRAEAEADREESEQRSVRVKDIGEYDDRATHWLWKGRIPVSGLSLIAGKGETSKSTVLCMFAAWISTGRMYGEYQGTPRTVLYIVNEDSIEETVRPRLFVNGPVDVTRVKIIEGVDHPILGPGPLILPRDIAILKQLIIDTQAVAVFIDPLSANTSGRKNDQGDMRTTYQAVNDLGLQLRVAIVGLAHTRKDAGIGDIVTNVMGSSEQTNVARSVHGLVMDDKEDGARILSCEKLNVGNRFALPSLRFNLETVSHTCKNGEENSQPRIKWLEETTDTASDVLASQASGQVGVSDALGHEIRHYVTGKGGQCPAAEAIEALNLAKISGSTLSRARRKVSVKSRREGDRWLWYMDTLS